MCIANNEYTTPVIDFTDTILLGHECPDGDHLLGYYNKVLTAGKGAGNAMLFALPAEPGTVNANSLIPMAECTHVMTDYKKAVTPEPPRMRGVMSFSVGGLEPAPFVVKGFDNGTYDVVIAPTANSIASVINQVAESKRPIINESLYAELTLLYPGFTFVLFCFSEKGSEQAGCALIKYTPMSEYQNRLFLPGLDGHNGSIERGSVDVNHTLIVSSHRLQTSYAYPVDFTDTNVPDLLPRNVIGTIISHGRMPQGDFLVSLERLVDGFFVCKRQLPPGADAVKQPFDRTEKPFYFVE